jgi:molybdenum cofactor biosynthesis enzyme MoaA
MARRTLTVISEKPLGTAFLEVPGLLMLRLMSRCNEKCVFCMVEEEIQKSDDVNYNEAVNRIMAQPEGTRIEFFGGEPTIYPRFMDLLRLARQRGHSCSIATNCRVFHSEKFTRAVAELDPAQIYVRTSLYGDTAELHDYYTATPGSYAQTIKGLKNLVAMGFRCQANVVIMEKNVDHLAEITRLVHSLGLPRIKYGNLVEIRSCRAHSVRLSQVRPRLQEAVAIAEQLKLTVTVEKTPVCVAGGRVDLISAERDLGNWERAFDDEGQCGGCLVRRWCEGLDPDYVALYGYEGINRLTHVPQLVLKGSAQDSGEPEYLKTHCVQIEDEEPDAQTVEALYGLLQEVESRHGRLAVFPRRYIESGQSEFLIEQLERKEVELCQQLDSVMKAKVKA